MTADEGSLSEFVAVEGGPAETVVAAAREAGGDAVVVTEHDDESILRLTPPDETIASIVAYLDGCSRASE